MNVRTDPSTRRAEMRAIRWLSLSHALGIGLFVVLMGLFFWYLQQLEADQQKQTLYRDITGAQTALRREFRDDQDELVLAAPDWSARVQRGQSIGKPVGDFLAQQPSAVYVAIADAEGRVVYVARARDVAPLASRAEGARIADAAGRAAFDQAGATLRPTYTAPFTAASSDVLFELQVPIAGTSGFGGTVIVGYSLNQVMSGSLLQTIRDRYQLAIVDRDGNTLVSSSLFEIDFAHLTWEVALDPPGHGVRLRAFAYEQQPHLVDRTLVAAVVGLSLAILASLVALWGHARRRLFAEYERDRLFTLSPDPLCVFETDGALVRGNPAFRQVLGAGERRRRIDRWVHPDDRDQVAIALEQIRRPGVSSASFEARFRAQEPGMIADAALADAPKRAAAGWRWLHWSLRRDPDAQRPLLYAVARDVTERRNAELALAAETAYRRAMENSMLTGMRAFDMEGRIGYVNPAFCNMVGFSEEELVGSIPPYPYWPTANDANRENLERVLAGRTGSSGFEVKVRRKDGSIFDARMYVSPLIDAEGRQTGWMTSMTDVTEPKRIREQLAAAHERFTTVLDELDAAVSVVARAAEGSRHGAELLFANRMYRSLFGADGHSHETLLEAYAQGGEASAPAEVFDATRGLWFDLRVRQIRWVDGSPVDLLVATDTTRRHEIEEQQREQDRKLQRTSRLVTMGEMASSLAHELNQPLTAIANYCMGMSARVRATAAAGQPVAPEDLLDPLEKTSAQAARAGEVIRRIRNFVKRSEPERRRCEVATIVADAVGLADIDARRLGIPIVTELPERLPSLYVDPILIEQVLLNLLKNGLDAMREAPDGAARRVVLAVEQHDDQLEFSVTDRGAGLPADTRERLFEPFFTTKSEGMGMGLNICRSIVESHKGRLWAQTPEGGGCSFRFTLPVDARVVAAVPA